MRVVGLTFHLSVTNLLWLIVTSRSGVSTSSSVAYKNKNTANQRLDITDSTISDGCGNVTNFFLCLIDKN